MNPTRAHRLRVATSFALGVVFALGLGVSRLVHPTIIRGGIDFAGDFDPTLWVGFAAALAAFAPLARLARRGALLADRCELPNAKAVDARLLAGAAIFGLGWGLAGVCPGPAVVWLATGSSAAVSFAVAMLAGMWMHRLLAPALTSQPSSRGAFGHSKSATSIR